MYSSIIRYDGPRVIDERVESHPHRVSQSRIIRPVQSYIDKTYTNDGRVSRVYESRIIDTRVPYASKTINTKIPYTSRVIDTTVPYTSKVIYGEPRINGGRLSERRLLDEGKKVYRVSNYRSEAETGSARKNRITKSLTRANESHYTYENGVKVIKRDEVRTNRIIPQVERVVETRQPVKIETRRSLYDSQSTYKSRIVLDDWTSYKTPTIEPLIYRSVINNDSIYTSQISTRPITYLNSSMVQSKYDNYDSTTPRRVYKDYESPFTRTTRIIRPSLYTTKYV